MIAPAALPDLGAYRGFVLAFNGGQRSLAPLHLFGLVVSANACVHEAAPFHALFGKTIDNRAIGPIIAVAGACQLSQRTTHRVESADLASKLSRPRFSQRLHLRARPLPIRPKSQQHADFLDRKSEVACVGNESQAVNISVAIVPVAATPGWGGNEPDLLIVPDHALGDAARLGRGSDIHSFTALRRSALSTTVKDDSAIAAPASMGESRMPATG